MKDTLTRLAIDAQLLAQGTADLNTNGIIGFFLSKIAPILLAILGIIFIARANKGEVSRVLTSGTIAILGIAFIAGGVLLIAFGNSLVDIMFTNTTGD